MKTLDEVIEIVEDRETHFNAVGCFYCHYSNHVECVNGCVLADALHYLKELRDMTDIPMEYFESGGTSQNFADTSQITCPKCHSEFVILPEANNPLTWDELRQMEGKPVWVEADDGKYKGWVTVGKFYSLLENEDLDAHVNLYYFGRSMEYSKEMYGYYWQAYRKERS